MVVIGEPDFIKENPQNLIGHGGSNCNGSIQKCLKRLHRHKRFIRKDSVKRGLPCGTALVYVIIAVKKNALFFGLLQEANNE